MTASATTQRVCAIAVTWNCRAQALALVASLRACDPGPDAVVVVDNASVDGTADAIAAADAAVVLLRQTENTGGAGGFAIGMRWALDHGYDLLWLLDGDACATPGALRGLLAALTPGVGVVGSRIVMHDYPWLVQEIGADLSPVLGLPRFRHALAAADAPLRSQPVDYVPACSLLTRADAVRAAGTFDPALFVFCDDIEWCARVRRAGWSVRTAPESTVLHPWHGAKRPQPWRVYYALRNAIELQRRIAPGPLRPLRVLAWVLAAARWQRRWRRSGQRALADAAALALTDAGRRRLGRRDDLPAPAPVDGCIDPRALAGRTVQIAAGADIAAGVAFARWWSAAGIAATVRITGDARLERMVATHGLAWAPIGTRPGPDTVQVVVGEARTTRPTDLRFIGDALVPAARAADAWRWLALAWAVGRWVLRAIGL